MSLSMLFLILPNMLRNEQCLSKKLGEFEREKRKYFFHFLDFFFFFFSIKYCTLINFYLIMLQQEYNIWDMSDIENDVNIKHYHFNQVFCCLCFFYKLVFRRHARIKSVSILLDFIKDVMKERVFFLSGIKLMILLAAYFVGLNIL